MRTALVFALVLVAAAPAAAALPHAGTLVPGRYRLWCSVANHRQLGMQAVLTVVRRK